MGPAREQKICNFPGLILSKGALLSTWLELAVTAGWRRGALVYLGQSGSSCYRFRRLVKASGVAACLVKVGFPFACGDYCCGVDARDGSSVLARLWSKTSFISLELPLLYLLIDRLSSVKNPRKGKTMHETKQQINERVTKTCTTVCCTRWKRYVMVPHEETQSCNRFFCCIKKLFLWFCCVCFRCRVGVVG